MPMPTTSPGAIVEKSTGSSVSSTRRGSPHSRPVAAARTYSQRGVITATPNESSLGLMRCTRGVTRPSIDGVQSHFAVRDFELRDHGEFVRAVDSRSTAANQLDRAQRCDDHELKSAHSTWPLHHRNPF